MDDNTTKVLLAVITLITPIVVWWIGRQTNKKVDIIEKKLDENHRLTNGHMTKLLQTTADLATANEKAKNKEETKKK